MMPTIEPLSLALIDLCDSCLPGLLVPNGPRKSHAQAKRVQRNFHLFLLAEIAASAAFSRGSVAHELKQLESTEEGL